MKAVKMAEQDTELICFHEHIKNTSTCGAVLTENWLETGWKNHLQQRLYEKSNLNWVGREGKQTGQDLYLWERTQRGEGLQDSHILPRQWMVPSTYWVPQLWGPTPAGHVPLAGLKTNGAYRRAVIKT